MKTPIYLATMVASASGLFADIADFKSAHPTDATHYKLVRTSIDAETLHAKRTYSSLANTYQMFETDLPRGVEAAKIRDRLKKMRMFDDAVLNDSVALLDLIKKQTKEGDELCIYDFQSGVDTESGFLAIRGAEIVGKWPQLKSMTKTEPNKALVPTVMAVTPAADAPVAPATTAAHL